jgi:hypothetical protein
MSENEPKTSVLTESQRKAIKLDFAGNSPSTVRSKKKRIRERARQGLRDFCLLAENLEPEERQKIFDAEPRSDEFMELEDDVTGTLFFLYTTLGGEPHFRRPLRRAVSAGESALGNADNSLNVAPKFQVNTPRKTDKRNVVDIVENEEWGKLEAPELFTFLKYVVERTDAVDFDEIRERIDWEDEAQEILENVDVE